MSLIDVMRMFPDDDAAKLWFAEVRWGEKPGCPKCGSLNVQVRPKHPSMDYRCRDCRRFFSVKTGTVMESSKLGLQIWALAIYLLATSLKGQSSMKMHRDLGITQKSAWHLAHRLREAWRDELPLMFEGPVEMDEAYFGGRRKNMSNAKRKELEGTGRGPVGKTPVVGMKDRTTNRVSAHVVEHVDRLTLHGLLDDRVGCGATLYTDDATAYRGSGRPHETVKHSVSEFVRGKAHTNGVESFWASLRRGCLGVYHQMSSKHLQRYVNEFSGRHNIRPLDTEDQMVAIAKGLEGKRLRFKDLTAPTESPESG